MAQEPPGCRPDDKRQDIELFCCGTVYHGAFVPGGPLPGRIMPRECGKGAVEGGRRGGEGRSRAPDGQGTRRAGGQLTRQAELHAQCCSRKGGCCVRGVACRMWLFCFKPTLTGEAPGPATPGRPEGHAARGEGHNVAPARTGFQERTAGPRGCCQTISTTRAVGERGRRPGRARRTQVKRQLSVRKERQDDGGNAQAVLPERQDKSASRARQGSKPSECTPLSLPGWEDCRFASQRTAACRVKSRRELRVGRPARAQLTAAGLDLHARKG